MSSALKISSVPEIGLRRPSSRAKHAPARLSFVRAVAQAEAETPEKKRLSPLEKGGTLKGDAALGKDAAASRKATQTSSGTFLSLQDGRFVDDRWINGTWDLEQFRDSKGEVDWDKVIDAEIARRKMLEETPIASLNEDPVFFDTGVIPWWAWVRRFHLPTAEKVNGRAAMVGYFMALVVDQLTGTGLLDQQNSFLGKVLLHVVVFGCLFIRETSDLDKLKGLVDEATFYDRQWQQTWQGTDRPSETEK
uniref:Low molecular mass early light-induced protein n=1 Tax=Tetraselmis sp. GSL018 TaxID=582737 RepID=A0A061R9N3_9CHLO|mmetsp:Transcript_11056/g.26218  ORF Transcript_11056/g.26218 Transcript_11056/m.26218 type:complete len:249 (+) Transcript_11056:139-885(+)